MMFAEKFLTSEVVALVIEIAIVNSDVVWMKDELF